MQENYIRFADKYFETLNATEAAIFAGLSVDTAKQQGWRILQREEVQEYLAKLRAEYADKSGLSKQWVLDRFKLISDNSIQGEAVLDKNGRPIGEYQFDSSGANKATEMIGRIIGVFEKDNLQKPIAQTPVINIINPNGK